MTDTGDGPATTADRSTGTTTDPDPTPIPPVLAAAVVAAWAELGNVTKGHRAQAGSYAYDYSDLADLVEMARPVLARHGLALLQPVTRTIGAPVMVETWLLHETGHMLRWTFETSGEGSPQVIGSAITYARRYCGQAALGIASEGADDDGRAASNVTPPRQSGQVGARRERDADDRNTARYDVADGRAELFT